MAKDCINNTDLPKVIKNGNVVTKEVTNDEGETTIVEVGPILNSNSYAAYFCDYCENNGIRPYYPLKANEITDNILKNLNRKYYEYLSENGNSNGSVSMCGVAYMQDTVTWNNYLGKNGMYAIRRSIFGTNIKFI